MQIFGKHVSSGLPRLLLTASTVVFSLCSHVVQAQDTSSSSSDAAAEAAALALAEELYPACALLCLAELIPQSACSLTDLECLCTNVPLNANLSVCVTSGCNFEDQLLTKNGSETMCGAEVRDETLKPTLVAAVGFSLAVFFYVLRILSALPKKNARPMGWDDWAITATVLLTVPPTIFAFLLSKNGLGKDIWTLPLWKIENVLFFYFIGELFYFAAQSMNKVAILLFLLRVFQHGKLKRAIWATMGLCLAFAVSFFFATLFQCWPINHAWLQLEDWHQGYCNHVHLQGWLSAAINIVLDIIILILPIHELYSLQMDLKKKLMLIVIFSMGIFVTITSVIRLRTLVYFANSTNITYDYMEAAIWSTIELYAGIVTCSLPAVQKLVTQMGISPLWTKLKSKLAYGSSSQRSGGVSGISTNKSGLSTGTMDSGKPKSRQLSLKRGDESDFIPLTDVESQKGRWN